MIHAKELLITGGSGLLGGELQARVPDALFPTHDEFDVENPALIDSYIIGKGIKTLVHAAAFTSPPRIDADPARAVDVNIIGTANIVNLCIRHGTRLIYISTDYVFSGDGGPYAEGDPVHPVNKYAWSKLGGECAVRMHDDAIIIRTSFGENEFPYEKAFVDQWTSRESVSEIADKIVDVINLDGFTGVLHVGGVRRTVFEYAQSVSHGKNIGELSVNDVSFDVPVDTSFDVGLYQKIVNKE